MNVGIENRIVDQVGDAGQIGTALQEEIVAIACTVGKWLKALWREIETTWPDAEKRGVQLKLRRQHKCAVMVGIVTSEKISDRGFRRGRLDRRMRLDYGG